MKKIAKWFVLPVISIIFLIASEISEELGGSGLCSDASWCWLWGPIVLFALSSISFIIGLVRVVFIKINKNFDTPTTPITRFTKRAIVIIFIMTMLSVVYYGSIMVFGLINIW